MGDRLRDPIFSAPLWPPPSKPSSASARCRQRWGSELAARRRANLDLIGFRSLLKGRLAEDILQEALVKVFNKLNKYSGLGSFEGWIRRITVNTALDFIRKNKKRQLNASLEEVGYGIKKEQFVVEELTAKELMKIIQKIPTGYRTIFNMYAIEGYSHKEIAQELSISESTSKSQLSRARATIKELLFKNKLI